MGDEVVTDMQINADPSKDFFIDMITRDIGVDECILDLVDNAVGQAVEQSGADVMASLLAAGQSTDLSRFHVELDLAPDRFCIADNCGGISAERARDEVFLFGNPLERSKGAGLSVYGIGMKRAIFKLGGKATITSYTATDMFRMTIDVEAWRKQPLWKFQFDEVRARKSSESNTPAGTSIEVVALRKEVSRFLSLSYNLQSLKDRLSSTYALFLQSGLALKSGNQKISQRLPTLVQDDVITPAIRRLESKDGVVTTLLVAGVARKGGPGPGGWYVFCNGRMVLEAEQSALTGWGVDGFPQFHPGKHRYFVGYLYFYSKDVTRLPWTTTKQGVVADSDAYQDALEEMRVQARPVLNFLNKVYPTDTEPVKVLEREALIQTTAVTIDTVNLTERPFEAKITVAKTPEDPDPLVNIQFKRRQSDLDKVRRCVDKLKKASAKRIGEYAIDYLISRECD
jgi:hypothetical protein